MNWLKQITSLSDLSSKLKTAYETNKRLNRRNQELESRLVRIHRQYGNLWEEARQHNKRAKDYADQLRDLYKEDKHSLREFYSKHWERLPKPTRGFDGIEGRVNAALYEIGKYQAVSIALGFMLFVMTVLAFIT